MQRRRFVNTMTQAAAWTALSSSRILGANNRVNVGVIGCGNRGSSDARLIRGTMEDLQGTRRRNEPNNKPDPQLVRKPGEVEITALCDVQQQKLDRASKWAPQAKQYHDFRKLLEAKDVDAVVVGTPDHWHASISVLACNAGKDVYVEKPVMYTIKEGPAIVEAVRRNNVILQVGTQHRSSEHIAEAARMIQSGKLGEVHFVRIWNYLGGRSRPPSPDGPVPEGLDWDFWLGPAPKIPFNPDRLNYRSWMDYGNGVMSDFGMHRFDSVHQIMGEDAPVSVSSSAIRYRKNVSGELPDIHQATFEYRDFVLSVEACTFSSHGLGGRTPGMRYHGMRGEDDRPHGMAYYGTEAALYVDRLGMELYPEPTGPMLSTLPKEFAQPTAKKSELKRFSMNEAEPTPRHCHIFIDNVRERKQPFADATVGTRSSYIPMMANIAAKVEKKLKWDAKTETFPGQSEANDLMFRAHRKPWDLVDFMKFV